MSANNSDNIPKGKSIIDQVKRSICSPHQRQQLEESFAKHKYLTKSERLELTKNLNISDKQLQVWFQNRRAREKKQRLKMSGQVNDPLPSMRSQLQKAAQRARHEHSNYPPINSATRRMPELMPIQQPPLYYSDGFNSFSQANHLTTFNVTSSKPNPQANNAVEFQVGHNMKHHFIHQRLYDGKNDAKTTYGTPKYEEFNFIQPYNCYSQSTIAEWQNTYLSF